MKSNIPSSPGTFVGREREIAQIERALTNPDINVASIYGVGGTGKTVLARLVVERLRNADRFSGGIVWIDCRIEDTLSKILRTIALTIDLQTISVESPALREEVLAYLRSEPTLLVLDAYEVVADDDEVLSFIGRLPKQTKALIVSRQRVRVPGREVTLRLGSLTERETLELLRQYLRLEQWAKADKEALREIHHWTGGLPLATALVGSLLQQGWSLPRILEQLQEGAIPAERVVERVLDQVDTILTEKQHRFLEALSVFAHPVDDAAIVAVAEGDWQLSVESLARKSVIEIVDGRYAMHPLVRTYFRNRIVPEQLEALERRMVRYYLTYTEKFQYDFDKIEREWLNIQYAIETAYRNQFRQLFIGLVLGLGQFPAARGYESDYQKWLNQALEVSNQIEDIGVRAALLHTLGVQYQQRGDLDAAVEFYKQSLILEEVTDDAAAESATLTNLGSVYRSRGDIRNAIEYYEQALVLSEQVGDLLGKANILTSLGVSYADLGDYRRAATYYQQALEISERLGDLQGRSNTLTNLGILYRTQYKSTGDTSDLETAIAFYHQALEISREIGDRRGEASTASNLGTVYRDRYERTGDASDLETAIAFYHQALEISREIGDRRGEASTANNLGTVYRDRYERTGDASDLETAIALYHQASEISREMGIGDRRGQAGTASNLGTVYRDRYARTGDASNLEMAIAFYHQALEISREIGDRRGEASTASNLGTVYRDRYERTGDASDLETAIALYHQALDILATEGPPLEYATTLNNLANAYLNRQTGDRAANIEQAIDYYRSSLKSSPPSSSFVASTTYNLGVALSQRIRGDRAANLRQAISTLEQALDLTPIASPDWLRVAMRLSIACAEASNWSKAKKIAKRVLQATHGHIQTSETLLSWYHQLGELAVQNQDTEFATDVFAEATHQLELQGKEVPDAIRSKLAELREQLGDDRFVVMWAEAQRVLTPVLAQTLHEVRTLMDQEQFSEAADKLSTALTLISEAGDKETLKRQKATILFLRGFCLRKQELWEDALENQEKSFRLFEELRDYVGEAHTFLEMGHLFEVMNNYEDARLHYMDAYRLYRRAENKHGMALASENLGRLEYRVRMFSQAVQNLEEARRLYISIGDRTKAATIDSDLEAARASLAYQAASNNK